MTWDKGLIKKGARKMTHLWMLEENILKTRLQVGP
jgi:hypothetical protein